MKSSAKRNSSSRLTCLIVIILVSGAGAGCQAKSDNNDAPATAVAAYLQAKVSRDENTVRRLLCTEMEAEYETEITTFEGVNGARIEGMACTRVGDSEKVQCQGTIVADYGAEKNEFPLTTYRVKLEDGEWKWCGETQ